jgi:hypothetical protein
METYQMAERPIFPPLYGMAKKPIVLVEQVGALTIKETIV